MSGLGEELEPFWEGLRSGRSCIRPWADKDPRIASKIGAQLAQFSVEGCIEQRRGTVPDRWLSLLPRVLRDTPLGSWMTACAGLQAYLDSGLDGQVDPTRVAHVCAGQNLSIGYYADNFSAFLEHPDDIEPLLGMIALDTDILGVISELLSIRGPSLLVGGACASGNLALLTGLDLIRSGRADAVVVTGAGVSFHSMILHAWTLIDAVTYNSWNDAPERASRPFDALREGFVPGEASGAVVLESLALARRRGAKIRGELLGGASVSDACRLPKPHVDGQARAIRSALEDARIATSDVDYINAHATSTPLGDAVEVAALKEVFGKRAYEIPVNATKSMIGHSLTSAAIIELIATLLQMEHGTVHPTINQEQPDPELDLDFVPNRARPHRIRRAISNSFGFGGINSCVVVGELE